MNNQIPQKPAESGSLVKALTVPGLYLLVFSSIGWLVMIANMFGLDGMTGWIFPQAKDIPGLGASTALLALFGLSPLAYKQLRKRKEHPPS